MSMGLVINAEMIEIIIQLEFKNIEQTNNSIDSI